jgi:hypothetical protein
MDIYIILCLIVLILIGVVALILQMISPILGVLGVIIGPLVGAFVGVYLGFKKNDNRRIELEEERRLFFRKLLMHEAKKSIELLPGTVNLIPEDAWNSIVNSGDIALLKDNVIELSDTYFDVQNYNYEAKIIRDAFEHEARWGLSVNIETGERYSRASVLKKRFDEITKPALLTRLKELEGWLSPLVGEMSTSVRVRGSLTVKDNNGKEK